MTFVLNKATPEAAIDKPFTHYNRTNAGTPQASLTPQYAGERVLDTTAGILYQALGTANSTWVATTHEA